ncbi:glycosyltransferase [Microbacterium aoyamense]|uniref:glycosyltransferase n=1 Tax=Microbacterium aoyamense TaxID=344166 RepID=UPI0020044E71|nr:glycosyltransferase [Microbacterium aoyamense]
MSVVIPAYNAASTIEDQFRALARQQVTFPWEVLVCDNGSTDDLAAVVDEWADRLPLRLVDASFRRGASAARNIGVTAARGASIAFCDADDVVADDWLELMDAALAVDDFIGAGGRRRYVHSTDENPEYFTWAINAMPYFPQLPFTGGGHMGVRTELFRRFGGFDESVRIAEDVEFCWRLQLAGHVLTGHPEAVVNVRSRDGLRALLRQSYNTGRGERQLRHTFARVIAAYAAQYPAPEPPPSGNTVVPRDAPTSLVGRAMRKLVSLRRPSDLARVGRLIAYRLGHRFGRIDRSRATVDPPSPLPPPPPPAPPVVNG